MNDAITLGQIEAAQKLLGVASDAQESLIARPNRHDRRSMKRRYRSDGLPKVGLSWSDCYTRVVKHRAMRKTKVQSQARRITRLAA